MKKILTFLLTGLLSISLAQTPVSADQMALGKSNLETGEIEIKSIENLEIRGFPITEIVSTDNRIIRTYTNSQMGNLNRNNKSQEEGNDNIKDLLMVLGMEQDFIDSLTDEDLEDYANCQSLVGNISYQKTTPEGEVSYVSQQEAEQESQRIRSEREKIIRDLESGSIQSRQDTLNGTRSNDLTWQWEPDDGYIRMFYMLTRYADNSFRFSSDVRWLNMPTNRRTDTLGSVAQNSTVSSLGSGWYEYDYTQIGYDGKKSEHYSKFNIPSSSISSDFTNGWSGCAASFKLPKDVFSQNVSQWYYDFKVHYEYRGHLQDPNKEQYFNTICTYTHSKIGIDISPSIGISTDGTVCITLIDILKNTYRYNYIVEIHYYP